MSAVERTRSAESSTERAARGYWAQSLGRIRREPAAIVALVIVVGLFACGGLAHQLAPQGWNGIDLATRWQNHPPTLAAGHYLGTDNIGRDILARTLWGLHNTESIALVGALLAMVLGLAAGGLAGFYGGWTETVLMRFADLVTTFPVIVLMLVVFALLEPISQAKTTIVFALYMWTFVARVIRARIDALGREEFVTAARALGASDARIFFRHLLPNAAGTLIVAATSMIGQILLVEATVEFFGFGLSSLSRPTLGNLTAEAAASGIGHYNVVGLGWWVWAAPSAVLVMILLCVNVAGDGLDAALNPRSFRR